MSERRKLLERELRTCHKCGARGELRTFKFGLATVVRRKVPERDSAGCLLKLLGLVLPIGLLLVFLPSETDPQVEPGEILELELRLCRHCGPGFWRKIEYEAHPLWSKARDSGFTRFVSQKELAFLVSQRGPRTLVDPEVLTWIENLD